MCVDEVDCDRLTSKLMMCSMGSRTDEKISKNELKQFTAAVLHNVSPTRTFDLDSFEKAY